jgi:hypothetical protein
MNNCREFWDAPQNEVPVRGFLHCPTNSAEDSLVLTHGAGANCDSPLLVALADAFCASGLTVLRCDLPFRQLRPQGPPPRGSAERDQHGLRQQLLPCDGRLRAACFWVAILTEADRRRCWPRLNPVSSINSCCSRTHPPAATTE